MPASVNNAVANGTLPWSLSTSFSEQREWPILVNDYRDGSSQRNTQAATSRKTYRFSKRLTASQLSTLRAFYLSHIGSAFKVYTRKADYDAGNNNFKLMRFSGAWNEEITLGRSNTSIELVELA